MLWVAQTRSLGMGRCGRLRTIFHRHSCSGEFRRFDPHKYSFLFLHFRNLSTCLALREGEDTTIADGSLQLPLQSELDDLASSSTQIDPMAYTSLLARCYAMWEVKLVHCYAIKNGVCEHLPLQNQLIRMYGKCNRSSNARQVFDRMPIKDGISWNSMVAAYAQSGHPKQALYLLQKMLLDGKKVDGSCFMCLFDVFCSSNLFATGRLIHSLLIRGGYGADDIGASLLNLYVKFGGIQEATTMFDQMQNRDNLSWNKVIKAYANNGFVNSALRLAMELSSTQECRSTSALRSIIDGCRTLAEGRMVHAYSIDIGLGTDTNVTDAIIQMYERCNSLTDVEKLFDKMPKHNDISWNAMIAMLNSHSEVRRSFELFRKMQIEGVKPNKITFVNILGACAALGSQKAGRMIHARIVDQGFQLDAKVQEALFIMYIRCGSVKNALKVFKQMRQKDVTLWNTVIMVLYEQGKHAQVLSFFQQMLKENVKPDSAAFVKVLSSCSQLQLVDEGGNLFESMKRDYGIKPTIEHYEHMADLLGEAGRAEEAEYFIKKVSLLT